MTSHCNIPDVQRDPDQRKISINQVGIKDLKHPLQIEDKNGAICNTVANATMTVFLADNVKGTHMSRFIELLNSKEHIISIKNYPLLMADMLQRLEADSGKITLDFNYFVKKSAPVSGARSYMDYDISMTIEKSAGELIQTLSVVIPVTSLCPCSKKISDYGAHNQRSHATITAEISDDIFINDIIALAEENASCDLYSILKRPDEKFITEKAYDNPKFVEDMIRDIATALNNEDKVYNYTLEVENFESIHNHSAYAMIISG